MATFGMMNDAYFVGKSTLLDWISNFLHARVEKVEECAKGAIYCHLFDAVHPGSIPMKRVDFTVKNNYEFVKNWKLLQTAFAQVGINKEIPVQRLIKAKYQDNLEFLQFMYKYCRDTYNGDPDNPEYNAPARRSKSKGGKSFGASNPAVALVGKVRSTTGNSFKKQTLIRQSVQQRSNFHGGGNRRNNEDSLVQENSVERNGNNNVMCARMEEMKQEMKDVCETNSRLQKQVEEMKCEQERLTTLVVEFQTERDFYFKILQECEQACKSYPDQSVPIIRDMLNILYNESGGGAAEQEEQVRGVENDRDGGGSYLEENDGEEMRQDREMMRMNMDVPQEEEEEEEEEEKMIMME